MQMQMRSSGIPVFEAMIRRSTAFPKAALAGTPIRELTARDRLAWQDYERLGNEVLRILG